MWLVHQINAVKAASRLALGQTGSFWGIAVLAARRLVLLLQQEPPGALFACAVKRLVCRAFQRSLSLFEIKSSTHAVRPRLLSGQSRPCDSPKYTTHRRSVCRLFRSRKGFFRIAAGSCLLECRGRRPPPFCERAPWTPKPSSSASRPARQCSRADATLEFSARMSDLQGWSPRRSSHWLRRDRRRD